MYTVPLTLVIQYGRTIDYAFAAHMISVNTLQNCK